MHCLVSFLKPLVSYIVIRPCNTCTVFHLLSDDTWQLSAGNGERKTGNGSVQFMSCLDMSKSLHFLIFIFISFSFSHSYLMLFLLFCCSIPNWVGSETTWRWTWSNGNWALHCLPNEFQCAWMSGTLWEMR